MKSIFTTKVGMTQVIDEDGVVTPVTVLKADENVVVQVKTEETDGYNAVQIGYMDKKEKNVKKPVKGHFDKAGASYKRYLKEVNYGNDPIELAVGDKLAVDIFEAGEVVDVVATSKGKGTQGAIKRWNYGRGPQSHGSKSHRVAGARAAGSDPARVFKGRKGSGKMGNERVTVQNLQVVKVNLEDSYILVKGAVPGPKGGLVQVKQAVKGQN
ncbi:MULTISPECIES: 50S ribosomal protein L3 [Anaerococcus]|uniref:Large ribosomal subunit protein uL3 n=1 Tax=Anaerococcus nagyae TaxID=1755241 RepID=A0A3E2TL75_9FIRM|nr:MULTISPECIES: 50S ribosomal protein L3 [Anaerococcus]MBP2069116.1 large subunit ribosomal protein L3 [Anaerococcus nagyae]MDU2565221.1 50S ribosomal protein L3 [Anaerococcus sp.]MDU3210938.1 50S ribosomal protein L3 [Anaerococcus sp.]RGB78083.1 50S ribosomal protein L3 [Anaerococcus nagyae]